MKMRSLVQQAVGENETILLFFGPFYYQWESALQSVLEAYEIPYKWGQLSVYVVRSCQIVNCEIDVLLPPGCHFATIPNEFEKEVVRQRDFVSQQKQYNLRDEMFDWTTATRYGPILFFEDFPLIYEGLINEGIEENEIDDEIPVEFFKTLRNRTKRANYFLNVSNKTVQMLLKNYAHIRSDSISIDLAKIIIRSLLIISQPESTQIDSYAKGLFNAASELLQARLVAIHNGR